MKIKIAHFTRGCEQDKYHHFIPDRSVQNHNILQDFLSRYNEGKLVTLEAKEGTFISGIAHCKIVCGLFEKCLVVSRLSLPFYDHSIQITGQFEDVNRVEEKMMALVSPDTDISETRRLYSPSDMVYEAGNDWNWNKHIISDLEEELSRVFVR